jgi:TrpR-related protein YerC/YecD
MPLSKETSFLIKALKSCEQHIELESFLEQILSHKELKELYNRLSAAEMLLDERPYTSIVRDTGVSSATVARIAKLLQKRNSGLRHVFYKIYGKEKYKKQERDKTSQYNEFSF